MYVQAVEGEAAQEQLQAAQERLSERARELGKIQEELTQ